MESLKNLLAILSDNYNSNFRVSFIPEPELNGFSRLASRGRKRGINLIGITQRPAEIGTRFRGNLDCIVCFALSLQNDWAVVREIMGIEAEKQVKNLKKYGFLLWTQDGCQVKQ